MSAQRHISTEVVDRDLDPTPRDLHGDDPSLGGSTIRFLGQIIADRYRVDGLIARGSMGHVYAATQLDINREIALKMLSNVADAFHPRFRRRFRREASVAAMLGHPNIVTIYDYGETRGGELYIVMEHVRGRPLGEVLREAGRFELARTLKISLQIARALRRANQLSAVHRDLKPANIMLLPDEDGLDFVKILDFGLAKLVRPQPDERLLNSDSELHTSVGSLLGTPAYMAPEQARGEAVDARTDIYAFGVLMFQMITGRLPFCGGSIPEMINMHLEVAPPRLAEANPDVKVPPGFEALILKCLAKAPEDRFQTPQEVLGQLKILWRLEADESYGTDMFSVLPIDEQEAVISQPIAPAAAAAERVPVRAAASEASRQKIAPAAGAAERAPVRAAASEASGQKFEAHDLHEAPTIAEDEVFIPDLRVLATQKLPEVYRAPPPAQLVEVLPAPARGQNGLPEFRVRPQGRVVDTTRIPPGNFRAPRPSCRITRLGEGLRQALPAREPQKVRPQTHVSALAAATVQIAPRRTPAWFWLAILILSVATSVAVAAGYERIFVPKTQRIELRMKPRPQAAARRVAPKPVKKTAGPTAAGPADDYKTNPY